MPLLEVDPTFVRQTLLLSGHISQAGRIVLIEIVSIEPPVKVEPTPPPAKDDKHKFLGSWGSGPSVWNRR